MFAQTDKTAQYLPCHSTIECQLKSKVLIFSNVKVYNVRKSDGGINGAYHFLPEYGYESSSKNWTFSVLDNFESFTGNYYATTASIKVFANDDSLSLWTTRAALISKGKKNVIILSKKDPLNASSSTYCFHRQNACNFF